MPLIATSTFTLPLPRCFRTTSATAKRDFSSRPGTETCSLLGVFTGTVWRQSSSGWEELTFVSPDMSARYGRQLVEDVKYRKECAEKVGLGFDPLQASEPQLDVNCATRATNSAEHARAANA